MRQWIYVVLAAMVLAPAAAADKKNELPELVVAEAFAPTETLRAEYGFYWNGIRISTAEAMAALSEEDYDIAFNFRVRGLAALFASGRAHVRSTGKLTNDDNQLSTQPTRYYSMGRWDGKNYSQTMTYDDEGMLADQQLDWPEKWLNEFEREPVPDELKTGPDPISVVLELITSPLSAAQNGNTVGGRIFDGDSVFDMNLNCSDTPVALEESSHSPYFGDAYTCEMGGELVAGKRILNEKQKKEAEKERKKREKKKAKGKEDPPPQMWVQPVLDGAFMLPVRAEASTGFGRVKMYLQSLERIPASAQAGEQTAEVAASSE